MRVFTCEDRFESMMTAIYDAWEWAIRHGHNEVSVRKEPILEMSFLDDYIHVDMDEEKYQKVIRSIYQKIGSDAYITVYYATLYKDDVLDDIYNYLRIGFKAGKRVNHMLAEPVVMKLMQIRRKVANETHAFREFARFDRVGDVFISHLEPKCNIIELTARHFADRMPSEDWMIIDDRRQLAIVHPKDGENYRRVLTEEELKRLKESERIPDIYQGLWRHFFQAIGIKHRENVVCQRNMFPIWMREHATEFSEEREDSSNIRNMPKIE